MIKLGYIGLGGRGRNMLKTVLDSFTNVEIVGLCDINEERLEQCKQITEEKTGKTPFCTTCEDDIFNLDIDCVMIMTYWETHIPLAIKAMKKDIRPGIEVGGAYSLNACFDLVKTYEETGVPVMMLENCCYGKRELTVLKMVKEGLFGEIVHCSGGYHHYLANEISHGKERYHYRLRNYTNRNCENYPTHELGPIANVLNINRGNRMVKLTSTASKARGLTDYIKDHIEDYPYLANTHFNQGDIITTVITCADGSTIVLTLDTTLPRAYSRGFTVRGTKGSYFEDNDSFFFADNKEHIEAEEKFDWSLQYKNGVQYYEENMHPLWKKYGDAAAKAGHEGMDYMVLSAFFESVEKQAEPPIDTYDTAAWMSITPLSEESILKGGAPVAIPDFTSGKWAMGRPVCELEFSLD